MLRSHFLKWWSTFWMMPSPINDDHNWYVSNNKTSSKTDNIIKNVLQKFISVWDALHQSPVQLSQSLDISMSKLPVNCYRHVRLLYSLFPSINLIWQDNESDELLITLVAALIFHLLCCLRMRCGGFVSVDMFRSSSTIWNMLFPQSCTWAGVGVFEESMYSFSSLNFPEPRSKNRALNTPLENTPVSINL